MSEHVHRALIVEDDAQIVEDVKDRLESLGHACDCAATQSDARQHLATTRYCYVLLDLEIPVRPKRMPRIENGQNLLEEIRREGINRQTPVIIMTGHGTDGYDLAVETMKKGADDYVGKPFPTGDGPRSLTRKIKEALESKGVCQAGAGYGATAGAQKAGLRGKPPAKLSPFQGGELVFHPNRVELVGRRILGAGGKGMTRRILEALAEKRGGRYETYSGDKLAERMGTEKGQNDAAAAVRNLRKTIKRALEEAGFTCKPRDVIDSGGPGYRLRDWIEVRRTDR